MLEILAPAGNFECAEAAMNNGANAVYMGLNAFSARQGADNFDEQAFRSLLQNAHFREVKVYLAMNTVVKDVEIDKFCSTLVWAWKEGVDAVILQDLFLGKFLHERFPEIVLHLSTQAGICTVAGAKLAKEYGFSRVILARETPLEEIARIAEIVETEVFVQGALCTAFSGQCFFSSFVGGNSGNRGRCKQPCRKLYSYDRNGNTERSYALSLSDLCVGEEIEKLKKAGVLSFKIEGRMRRAEYVAAAVRYYRQILDEGRGSAETLSDLKRTYNRGNYTRGLAFGQDKHLLSTAIQGHIGEKVGVVKVVNGKFLVESQFKPQNGDSFKILRGGMEVGGANYAKMEGKSFVITSKIRLKNGDGVFVTTDTAVNARMLSGEKRGSLSISLFIREGENPKGSCGDFVFTGRTPVLTAQNHPLTREEVESCFQKTDGLPVDILFEKIEMEGKSFLPKSELNAFRREFYARLAEKVCTNGHCAYDYAPVQRPTFKGVNEKTAAISDDFTGVPIDIAVYKPSDYRAEVPLLFTGGRFEKYLYVPPFLTETDVRAVENLCRTGIFDGVYAESYNGLAIAKEWGVKLFAGIGFHILNSLSLQMLLREDCISYYAISKEANAEETKGLLGEKAFALSSGNIKLMDLCYCPFGKTCGVCDKQTCYHLTDEGGRTFPVKRWIAVDGSCRFEVYNCADLIGRGIKGAGQLLDLTVTENKRDALLAKDDEDAQKRMYKNYTSGHYKRGIL